MARNVEIKARVRDVVEFERRAAAVADGPPATIDQHDTFFEVPRGRLKLRAFADGTGELIHYVRPSSPGPTQSDYRIARTGDAAGLGEVLARALGRRGTVRKRRRLYLSGQTRIHIDRVEGLGEFVELEVVLRPAQTPADGRAVAERLMRTLGIDERDLIESAYVDLFRRL